MTDRRTDLPSLAPPGIMLGIGLGGFFDGIVLHQIFQTHAMLSAVIPMDSMMNMNANMLADGLFHALMWMATLIGVALLWRALNGRRGASAPGWRLIGYNLPITRHGTYFAWIWPQAEHAHVGWEFGTLLEDSDAVLQARRMGMVQPYRRIDRPPSAESAPCH